MLSFPDVPWASECPAAPDPARTATAAALEQDWAAAVAASPIGAQLAALAALDPQTALERAAPLIARHDWVGPALAPMMAAMAADPWMLPPLRTVQRGASASFILAEAAPLTLSLVVNGCDGMGDGDDDAVLFGGAHALVHVIDGGGATLHHYALADVDATAPFSAAGAGRCVRVGSEPLVAGKQLLIDQNCQSYAIGRATRDVVMLHMIHAAPGAVPVRQHDRRTGVLVRIATSQRGSSFAQMALSLLRTMGRRDAVPQFIAALGSDDFTLRWHAMRELVALDARAARPHLTAMAAGDAHDEVRRAAARTVSLVDGHLAAAMARAA